MRTEGRIVFVELLRSLGGRRLSTFHIGEIYALISSMCFTLTAVCFEQAGKRIGSLYVNLIRLVMAFLLLAIFNYFSRTMFLPIDINSQTWFWLSISGLIGFFLGDLFLFRAYIEIGSRISMLIMISAPPITAIAGFFILGQKISFAELMGMLLAVGGIGLVILTKDHEDNKIKFAHPVKGITYAFIGALGQAFGLIFSKIGIGSYNAFAASQIRIIAGIIGFALVVTIQGKWKGLLASMKEKKSMQFLWVGSFFGPFTGVSLSLLALKYANAGIVATLSSLPPIIIIPAAVFILREKVKLKEIIGVFISVIGVAILFI